VLQSGTERTEFKVDQTLPLASGQSFRAVGTVELDGEIESTLTIRNSDTTGFVILDALQLVPVDSPSAK